jgi:hypothetical protein
MWLNGSVGEGQLFIREHETRTRIRARQFLRIARRYERAAS